MIAYYTIYFVHFTSAAAEAEAALRATVRHAAALAVVAGNGQLATRYRQLSQAMGGAPGD